MGQPTRAGRALVAVALALLAAGCSDGSATRPIAASQTPSSKASQPAPIDPSLAAANRADRAICDDMYASYHALRDNSAVVTAVAQAAAKDGKPKQAAAALRALIVDYQTMVTKHLALAHNAKLKTALGADSVYTGVLIKKLDEAGSNGAKVADVILTVQWRALGQSTLVACGGID